MDVNMTDFIENAYSIKVLQISQVQGGWSAFAYNIQSENCNYFLKVFDKHKHTSQSWINNLDYYIPIVLWLYNNTLLREKIISPIVTNKGLYKCENEDYVFVLYPYINGTTPADKKLTSLQQKELAKIVAELHLYGQDVPNCMLKDIEDFNISFCDILLYLIREGDSNNEDLLNAWIPYKNLIAESIEKLKEHAKIVINSNLSFVLCHTDLHGWNLLQADNLILLDWEGLKLAPAEADLFSFSKGYFFDYAMNTFLSVYTEIHPNYTINQNALDFYRLRRRLEDITAFAEGILYDNLSKDEIIISLNHLIRECSFL